MTRKERGSTGEVSATSRGSALSASSIADRAWERIGRKLSGEKKARFSDPRSDSFRREELVIFCGLLSNPWTQALIDGFPPHLSSFLLSSSFPPLVSLPPASSPLVIVHAVQPPPPFSPLLAATTAVAPVNSPPPLLTPLTLNPSRLSSPSPRPGWLLSSCRHWRLVPRPSWQRGTMRPRPWLGQAVTATAAPFHLRLQ
jgi:hypothetical protein